MKTIRLKGYHFMSVIQILEQKQKWLGYVIILLDSMFVKQPENGLRFWVEIGPATEKGGEKRCKNI